MRVIAAPQGPVGGGMGRVTTYLMQEQARRTDLPSLVALETRGPGSAALSPLWLASAAARLVWQAWRGRVSVLHVNVAERGSVVRKGVLVAVARLCGVPVLLHLHAAQIVAFYDALPAPGRALVRTMFRSAALCVVLGEPWRAWVASLGVPDTRIRILRNGVPLPCLVRRLPASGDPFRVLFLGNLFERKGIADLLDALARPVLAECDWSLVVAGGGEVARYQTQAMRLGIGERVRFLGWVDQDRAASCLAEADALALPSYDEGLPLVILEALALGVPVVTTPVGAIAEVLTDGANALLVQPGDTTALAAAMARLVAEPGLCERLSREGRALYVREFTLSLFATRVAALHAEVGR